MTGGSEDPKPKYHGKRRNAFVGNIKYRPRRYSDHDVDQQESSNRNVHERIRGGGIQHRLRFPAQSVTNRYKIVRAFDNTVRKDEEGDEIMRNTEGTSSDLTQRRPQNPYRYRNVKSSLPIARRGQRGPTEQSKTYAIGEKENGYKPFIQSQSNCRLKCIDQNVFDLIVNFLNQYFVCYDSNREELLAAYHKNALFSLSLNVNSQSTSSGFKFGSYFKESRNLLYVTGYEKKHKMLHSGNLDIVAFVTKMPKTEHDSSTLKLDTCFFSPNMITFSVSGLFKEIDGDQKIKPLRSFQRVFVCVPTQTGQMTIVNEQFTISNPSKIQLRGTETQRAPTISDVQEMAAQNIQPVQATQPLDPILAEIQDPIRRDMIVEFSKFSKLTFKWAKDCLEYSNWNYEQAMSAFTDYKTSIPSDAFIS